MYNIPSPGASSTSTSFTKFAWLIFLFFMGRNYNFARIYNFKKNHILNCKAKNTKTRYRSTIQFRNSIFLISTQFQKCNFTVNFLEWRIRARTRTWFSSAFSFRRNSKKTGSFHQTTFAEIRYNPSWKINKILILTILSNIVWQSETKNKQLIVKNKQKIFFQDKTKSEGKSLKEVINKSVTFPKRTKLCWAKRN